jgi:hypothetical protein
MNEITLSTFLWFENRGDDVLEGLRKTTQLISSVGVILSSKRPSNHTIC